MSTALRSPESAADRPWRFGKELNGYVRDGELRYINVGRGTKKLRRKFTDPDLDELVERRAKRAMSVYKHQDSRSITSTFNPKVIGFTALRDARTSAKLKPSSRPNGSEQNSRRK